MLKRLSIVKWVARLQEQRWTSLGLYTSPPNQPCYTRKPFPIPVDGVSSG